MGIYIKVAKYKETNRVGYYTVSTKDFGGANFYIGIDKINKRIGIYDSKDVKSLVGSIDCTQEDKPIGCGNTWSGNHAVHKELRNAKVS